MPYRHIYLQLPISFLRVLIKCKEVSKQFYCKIPSAIFKYFLLFSFSTIYLRVCDVIFCLIFLFSFFPHQFYFIISSFHILNRVSSDLFHFVVGILLQPRICFLLDGFFVFFFHFGKLPLSVC